ncbi:MAG: hypothetical protein CM1200mP29_12920 [Verrucomicrobiota bacterium]|nr:MAG: hypothetical protein CM1200mP29_12920 [Verrucomicrobiota bacterium]
MACCGSRFFASSPAKRRVRLAKRMDCTVATFYQFANLPDFEAKRTPLKEECDRHSVQGTINLAHEGINGTIAGQKTGWSHCSSSFAATSVWPNCPLGIRHRADYLPPDEGAAAPGVVTLGTPEADPRGRWQICRAR